MFVGWISDPAHASLASQQRVHYILLVTQHAHPVAASYQEEDEEEEEEMDEEE